MGWVAVVAIALAAGPWQRARIAAAIEPLPVTAPKGGLSPRRGPGRPLRGRTAGAAVPAGATELATAILLAGLVAAFPVRDWPAVAEVSAFGWLAVVAVPLAAVDVAVLRLPDHLNALAYTGTLTFLTLAATLAGRHGDLLRAVLGGLALGAFYLLLFLINPSGTGLGDVKLAAALGTALGWLGWTALLAATFLAYLAAALYGLALMAFGRAGRTSEIPFGPFMLLGAFAVILATG